MHSHFYSLCHFEVFCAISNGCVLCLRLLSACVQNFIYDGERERKRQRNMRVRWKHCRMWVRNEKGDRPVALPLAVMKMFATKATVSALAVLDLILLFSFPLISVT